MPVGRVLADDIGQRGLSPQTVHQARLRFGLRRLAERGLADVAVHAR